ncbi:molybdopterin molybdotransferase MoeA [Orrella daihaiensis]|uniref:Molybdopterin molybdenumtransferase n=2 Tax=Orrella daihaiensis TaxID=2782176 RepID=A0ABY4AMP7_9BURK|nr:molybdopterin molybdotransferase MoeA [Orrella daihaiensis]
MLDFDAAKEQLLSFAAPPVITEDLPLLKAHGRVLAKGVTSPMDVPAFANSSMDGYAICPVDHTASSLNLTVTQRIAAGSQGTQLLPGQAARIFTGAPVPPGTYAVVPQEVVEVNGDQITIVQAVKAGDHVRAQGEDICVGTEIIAPGKKLKPADLALAASVGVTHVTTYKPLTVAILLTGDELVEPGNPLGPGQIYNSNRYWLQSLLTEIGCNVLDPGIVRDTPEDTRAALHDASQQADVIITCGGVSVGEEDHVRAAVASMGRIDLWQIAMKPGKPLAYGKANHADFIGLPGNPVSAFVTFVLMGLPFLQVRMGLPIATPIPRMLTADFDWPKADRRREFIRVKQKTDGQGSVRLERWPNQGSGVMSSVAWADGLVDIAAGQTIARGDAVPYLSFRDILDPVK